MAEPTAQAVARRVNRVAPGAELTPASHSAGLYRAAMFNLGAWLARICPLALLRAFGALAGRLYALTHPRRVAVVRGNLQLLDSALGEKAARNVYAEFGRTLADYFYIGARPPGEAMRIIAQVDGLEHLRHAHELGKGALVVTAHFGLFELGGLLLAQHGYDAVVLTYPEPSEALSRWRAAFRARWKVDTLEVGTDSFAFLQIAERLRRGNFVATLIDRPHPTDSTPVALPHGTAHFSTGILLLAAHGGVPVVPATMVRRANGAYHAQVFAPIFIESRGSRADTLGFYTKQIADTIAPVLCAYPEQWYQFVPASAPTSA
jgi:KDO2-lipid IV(A) lauroyltransferase